MKWRASGSARFRGKRASRGAQAARAGALMASGLAAAALCPGRASAQYVPNYFPTNVPGYDRELGVTVTSRVRPLYEPLGVRVGSFVVRSGLDESIGYNDNVLGEKGSPSSWFLETQPSISINSDWSRNRVGVNFSLDDLRFFDTPNQNRTDWNAAIGGGYIIGRGELALAYSHLALHQSPTDITAIRTATPVPYSVDNVRADYTFDFGRLKITPNAQFSLYRFDNVSSNGRTFDQTYRNRNVAQGGAAVNYELSQGRSIVVVLQGYHSDFTDYNIGAAPDSSSVLAMAGLDYQSTGVWRYRLLVGAEFRHFNSSAYKDRTSPIVQGDLIWTPTGLTTVTASVTRTIEDPVAANDSGYTFTWLQARVDHELRRNILLQADTGLQIAEYLQSNGGTTTSYYAGASATWLLNRRVRLSGEYRFTVQNGGNNNNTTTPVLATGGLTSTTSSHYTQNVGLLTLHLAL